MYISKLILRNFRNFKSAEFNFQKGVNTVIGENGSGKTNFFYALRLLLDNTLPRHIGFNERDFSRKLGDWRGQWIILTVIFNELELLDETLALSIHTCGQVDIDSQQTKGSYTLCFRPKTELRRQLYKYSQEVDKDKIGLQEILNKITIDDYETIYLCRGSAEFNDDESYKKYIGDFELINFPDPDLVQSNIYGTFERNLKIYDELSCTFVKALRDVANDLRSYSNNPLVKLLKGKDKSIRIATETQLIEDIGKINESISSLSEVVSVQKGIDNSIKQAVGTTYAPNIEIRAELPNEMDKLLQSLKLWVGDSDDEYRGQISELSLGGANLIFLSLKLLEYEKIKTDKVANLLLIEEPEAHIHTHIQKTLFDNLHQHNTQIFVSTHSTQISSVSKISSVNILSRENKQSIVFNPANGLDTDEINRIERYLDAVRSDLLFAKGVFLVEGDAEQILIPEIFQKVFGLSLDEIGVSLINIGSTGFKNIARIFHQDRINRKCAIITDLDESFIKLPININDDSLEQRKARNSEESGKNRKVELDLFCKDNECINPFFANHTFEVDLIFESNSDVFVRTLADIYKQQANISISEEKLIDPDIEICGTEALRIADKEGKGWFALKLAEQVNEGTHIPNYILEAIAWASPHINSSSVVKSAKYRLNTHYELNHHDIKDGEEYEFDWDWKNETYNDDKHFIERYREELAKDPLTVLLGYIYDFK